MELGCALPLSNGVVLEVSEENAKLSAVLAQSGSDRVYGLVCSSEGFDPNAQTMSGMTALMICCDEGNSALASAICSHKGTDLNLQNNIGWTALMFAVDRGHEACVDVLLSENRLDLTKKGFLDGNTALLLAASRGNSSVLRKLVQARGIEEIINWRNSIGWNACMVVSFENMIESAKVLFASPFLDIRLLNHVNGSSLNMACLRNNMEIVTLHLERSSSQIIHRCWFPRNERANCLEILMEWSCIGAADCLAVWHFNRRFTNLPFSVVAQVLFMAFGNRVVSFGSQRGCCRRFSWLLGTLCT